MDDKSAEELAFDELAALVRERDQRGVTFTEFLRQLEREAVAAARRLEVARAHADVCCATKLRKPRCDRGRKRSPAAAASSPPVAPGDHGPQV